MSAERACKWCLKGRKRHAPSLMLSFMATGLYQKALWHESALLQLLPVSPLMLEWSWKQHKHKRDQREVNWWEEAMPISKVKKEGWCDRERRVRKEGGLEEGEEGEKRSFVLHPHRGLGTLCTWAHLLWCVLLIPRAMSTWLARGWRQVTIQIILHPFMAISVGEMLRRRAALESCKPFRRGLLHYRSSS